MSRPSVGTKKKKILSDTVMENMASSIDDDGDSSDFAHAVAVSFRPQEGSLAAALGLAVDPSSISLPVRMASDSPTGSNAPLTKKKTLFDATVQNMVSSSRSVKEVTDKEIAVSDLRPQAGSLAAALGMGIDCSTKAAPIRQRKAMLLPSVGTKKKTSLADAVMENIASSFDEGSDSDDTS
jgi:hypothetical protein